MNIVEQNSYNERHQVAFLSVIAALFLTLIKLIVGYLTGSLGIISEALHSSLDLLAAIITFFAVKFSIKPADDKFHYGRGKIESFSALIEVLLLLLTCFWIFYEAFERLSSNKVVNINISIWAFLVMIISIIVDFTRAKSLYNVAKKYNSQALMADALHFSSDILSSFAVILGLIFTKMGFLHADTIAALIVAFVIIFASFKLGIQTINCLLDKAPEGLSKQIEDAIMSINEIEKVTRLRIRTSGSNIFVDANINVSNSLSLEKAHDIALQAEKKVKDILSDIDIVIHPDPILKNDDTLYNQIIGIANKFEIIKEVHNITLLQFSNNDQLTLELHVTVDSNLLLKDVHDKITEFEKQITIQLPQISNVNTHIDITLPQMIEYNQPIEVSNCENNVIAKKIENLINDMNFEHKTKYLESTIRNLNGKLYIVVKCALAPDVNMLSAHEISDEIEHAIHNSIENVKYVLVHIEPLYA